VYHFYTVLLDLPPALLAIMHVKAYLMNFVVYFKLSGVWILFIERLAI
jgi:hypothetical protein